jgi:hypothetical protein
VVRSKAATRCGAGVLGVRAPQTVLPSKVMTRRPLTTWVRVQQNAATTVSETSAPTRVKARRIADSLGRVDRAAPSSMSSSMLVSLTHSPITANDQAPPSTTATPTASKPGNACRTPRGCRGSGTRPNSINRSDRAMVDAAETVVQTMTSARVILSVRSSCKNHYSSPMGHTRPTRDTTPEPEVTDLPVDFAEALVGGGRALAARGVHGNESLNRLDVGRIETIELEHEFVDLGFDSRRGSVRVV